MDILKIDCENDILLALSWANREMKKQPFSEVDRQKVFVSISELLHNVINHSNSNGEFSCSLLNNGIQISVKDFGKGIASIDDALNGIKSPQSSGLGLGLNGVRRLMDDFSIQSKIEGGTIVVVTKRYSI